MNDIHVRPFRSSDAKQLDLFRWNYTAADLEIPKGYVGENLQTVIAEKDQKFLLSLTGTIGMVIDPMIKDPDASPADLMRALIKAEAVMSYLGAANGAQDVYIAIPNQLEKYMGIVEKSGYKRTVEHCTVFRRPIRPDTVPLIGEIRDLMEKKALAEAELRDNVSPVAELHEDAVE